MLNSVNTEIFITLNDQRRLNNKSFRTAAFSALDHDDAWHRLHALVHEPHSFRHEPHARERFEQHPQPFRPEYERGFAAGMQHERGRNRQFLDRTGGSCLAVRFSAVGAFAPALRSKYGGLQITYPYCRAAAACASAGVALQSGYVFQLRLP